MVGMSGRSALCRLYNEGRRPSSTGELGDQPWVLPIEVVGYPQEHASWKENTERGSSGKLWWKKTLSEKNHLIFLRDHMPGGSTEHVGDWQFLSWRGERPVQVNVPRTTFPLRSPRYSFWVKFIISRLCLWGGCWLWLIMQSELCGARLTGFLKVNGLPIIFCFAVMENEMGLVRWHLEKPMSKALLVQKVVGRKES